MKSEVPLLGRVRLTMGIGGGWRASQEEMVLERDGLRSRRVELMVRLDVRPQRSGERSRSTRLSFQSPPVGVEVPGLDRLDDAGEEDVCIVLVVVVAVVFWAESDFVPLILANHCRRSFLDLRQCKMAKTAMVRTTAML